MYCAKLTLIDRRHNAVRATKSKHANGFKRNCLKKEPDSGGGGGASRTLAVAASGHRRNRYATPDNRGDDGELDEDTYSTSLSDWSVGSGSGEAVPETRPPQPRSAPQHHPKTPLTVTTLDISDDVKGQFHAPSVPRDPRSFRVPPNLQQYQQTILSRSIKSFTNANDSCDKSGKSATSAIWVLGEKIEGQNKPQKAEGSPGMAKGPNEAKQEEESDRYHMMNALGETNISFYDFQRTWSIEDYDCEDEEDGDSQASLSRRLSTTSGTDNKVLANRFHRRIIRPPSPKTKQIIRVNVVKVTSS